MKTVKALLVPACFRKKEAILAAVAVVAVARLVLRLEALVDRYHGRRESDFARWLLARRDDEMAIRVVPMRFSAWDYSRRMA